MPVSKDGPRINEFINAHELFGDRRECLHVVQVEHASEQQRAHVRDRSAHSADARAQLATGEAPGPEPDRNRRTPPTATGLVAAQLHGCVIDEAAEERGLTRSSFLADSARQRIATGM
jgi:hypothetical protein